MTSKKNTQPNSKNAQFQASEAIRAFSGMVRLWWRADIRNVLLDNSAHNLDTIDVHLIWELGATGPARPSTLATYLGLGAPAITKRLARLESLNITHKQSDPTDGRALLVNLTAQGTKIAEQFQNTAHNIFETVTAEWDAEEKELFVTLLARYTDGTLDLISTYAAS